MIVFSTILWQTALSRSPYGFKPPYGFKSPSPVPSYDKLPSPDQTALSRSPYGFKSPSPVPSYGKPPYGYKPSSPVPSYGKSPSLYVLSSTVLRKNRPLHIALPLFQTVLSSTVLRQTALSIPPYGYKPSKPYSILKAPSLRPLSRLTLSALFGTNYAPYAHACETFTRVLKNAPPPPRKC